MRRVVISTVGTSLLTNQINRKNSEENDWYDRLRNTANLTEKETPEDVKRILEILKQRAEEKLAKSTISVIRGASAELNGIYGIYQGDLQQGKEDIHFLIATDTTQGVITAKIVEDFLKSKAIANVNPYIPKGLSTASSESFSLGIDDLIVWLQKEIAPLKSLYKITFNLVGSFKSLQGYLNTIGMFYADEIVYIFEGKDAELITIPRLPITVDTNLLQPHALKLALLDSEGGLSPAEVEGIPEAMLAEIDSKFILSTWGELIWNQCKDDLLSGDLLNFPRLEYLDVFRADYNKIKETKERVKLQETLAKVSHLLDKSNGDTSVLKQHTGLQYDKYTNMDNIDHFRVTQGLRVSCRVGAGKLILHRYGKEPEVNKNPY
jgi:CRISPR/Cas system-associated protein Csm6